MRLVGGLLRQIVQRLLNLFAVVGGTLLGLSLGMDLGSGHVPLSRFPYNLLLIFFALSPWFGPTLEALLVGAVVVSQSRITRWWWLAPILGAIMLGIALMWSKPTFAT